jgi:2-polyprenyl-6-methoxyphenol hydroxylase-like FAD-dependent oxidoreductase
MPVGADKLAGCGAWGLPHQLGRQRVQARRIDVLTSPIQSPEAARRPRKVGDQPGLLGGVSAAGAEVLVIGAGPSGLFAAVELARHGVRARLVEREPQPHRQARATAMQPATLEILAQAGVAEQVLASSVHLAFARVFDAALTPVSEMAFAGAGCPWDFECSLPQWRTEQILADRLTELGGAVERGVAAVSMQQRDDGVLVTLERADGTSETAEAAWVVGAGGAHSVTRETMAGALAGTTYPGVALVADVRVSCGLPRDGSALIASPEGYVLLAPLPGERWLTFAGDLDEAEHQRLENDTSIDAVAAAIKRRVADAISVSEVAWAAPFRMHHRLVPRLAGQRWFLLGDAGHLSSPFGGEGLNSGIHDGHNLGWKLAVQLRGRARPGLLESFASERLAADRHVLEVSDRLHQLAHRAVESARTGVFPAPPTPAQTAAMVRSRSMLDVSYAGTPLVGEYLEAGARPGPAPVPGDRYPDRISLHGTRHHLLIFGATGGSAGEAIARLRRRWHGLVEIIQADGDPRRGGLAGPGAILVRPDGRIGFRVSPASPAGLAALDSHLNTYLIPG